MIPTLLNTMEIVEITGEKRRAVYTAMRDGKFPAIWLGPRRPRCPRHVLEKFLRGEPVADHYFKGKPKTDKESEDAKPPTPTSRFE